MTQVARHLVMMWDSLLVREDRYLLLVRMTKWRGVLEACLRRMFSIALTVSPSMIIPIVITPFSELTVSAGVNLEFLIFSIPSM